MGVGLHVATIVNCDIFCPTTRTRPHTVKSGTISIAFYPTRGLAAMPGVSATKMANFIDLRLLTLRDRSCPRTPQAPPPPDVGLNFGTRLARLTSSLLLRLTQALRSPQITGLRGRGTSPTNLTPRRTRNLVVFMTRIRRLTVLQPASSM